MKERTAEYNSKSIIYAQSKLGKTVIIIYSFWIYYSNGDLFESTFKCVSIHFRNQWVYKGVQLNIEFNIGFLLSPKSLGAHAEAIH